MLHITCYKQTKHLLRKSSNLNFPGKTYELLHQQYNSSDQLGFGLYTFIRLYISTIFEQSTNKWPTPKNTYEAKRNVDSTLTIHFLDPHTRYLRSF